LEQGSFNDLNAAGGYVSTHSLSPADWAHKIEKPTHHEQKIHDHSDSSISVTSIKSQLIVDDTSRRSGDVAVYTYYIKAVGWLPTGIFVVTISAFVFLISFPSIWVMWWSEANSKSPNSRLGYYLGIYSLIGVLAFISLVISCW